MVIEIIEKKIRVDFDHFYIECCFFEAAGAVVKIGLSLKTNHHKEI
jgi:hypothetical protein